MIITNNLELNKYMTNKTATALGTFDAFHKGHMKVIENAVEYARRENLIAMVQFVESDYKKINSFEKRIKILEEMGVDIVVVEKFTDEFRTVDYQTFISEYLAKKYNAGAVFVGENYRFGHKAEGDVQKLSKLCHQYGIEVFVQKSVVIDAVVSSTEIRKFVDLGNLDKVKEYMGRPFSVEGEVVSGKALGRKIGFPTANINIPPNMVMPPLGVYATRVLIDGETYFGITNIGTKPTVDDQKANIETYLLGFSGDVYGKKIEVEFHKKIRDIRRFNNMDELKC